MRNCRQLPFILVGFFTLLNAFASLYVFDCSGTLVEPVGLYAEKIKAARNLFVRAPKTINSAEPKYFVRITSCYNAWANLKRNEIWVSEPVVRDFSVEEVAAIMGHEFGHLELGNKAKHHWEVDVVGAELTSRDFMIKQKTRMIDELNKTFEQNRL